MNFLRSFLCALCANPGFQDKYKFVSHRREKKGRLRRDVCLLRALCAKLPFLVFHSRKSELPLFISV